MEYQLESLPDLVEPVVLDIGANRGNFARYTLQRYPGAVLHCYEPNPETFAVLRGAEDLALATCTQAAVTRPARGYVKLYMGVNGDEECSLRDDVRWPHLSQRLDQWVLVDTVDAATLPPCDVLKVDTEGSEVEIVSGYRHLDKVRALLIEPHPVRGDVGAQVKQLEALAEAAGLRRVDSGYILRFIRLP